MKFKLHTISLIFSLTALTGSVTAKSFENMELVIDKTVTMRLIVESFEQQELAIETIDFQKDLKVLLAKKPYKPKTRYVAFDSEINRYLSATAED